MIGLKAKDSIVILTGAGISAESGIQTFRGSDGLWCGHKIEDVATPEGFARNPALVHDFYNGRRRQLLSEQIAPNPAHLALARLEAAWAGRVHIITQNIDNLHERAGSKNLIHMHGELLRMFCLSCGRRDDIHVDLGQKQICTHCGDIEHMRPDIVWFGEIPYAMDRIEHLLADCDLFIAIGTSGNVYPAAGFARAAYAAGAVCVECNLEESQITSAFHHHMRGPAALTVPKMVEDLLKSIS